MTRWRKLSRRAALGGLAVAGAAGVVVSSLVLRNGRRESQAVLDNLLAFYRHRTAAASWRALSQRPARREKHRDYRQSSLPASFGTLHDPGGGGKKGSAGIYSVLVCR